MPSNLKYSENEVQSLKAQEAKDYCLELMERLEAKEGGPISPGEVQLQELKYELELKEAEAEDNRLHEEYLARVKQLEFEIELARKEWAQTEKQSDEQREKYSQVICQVAESQEKLSVQLDRSTREYNVKLQMLQSDHETQRLALSEEIKELSTQRDCLIEQIGRLVELNSSAEDVDRLRSEIAEKQRQSHREQKQLDEALEAALFEKESLLKRTQREQELELAEIMAAHRKNLLDSKTGALEAMLEDLGLTRIDPADLKKLQKLANEQRVHGEQEEQVIRETAIEDFKRTFNISFAEPIDVTDLFYREKSLQEDNTGHLKQIQKLESEVLRMRTHIESESSRVAHSIEAARTNIQNNIEPGVKR